jgi:calcium channel MID1
MLPQTLLCLLSAAITFAQTVQQLLPLNKVVSIALSGTPGSVFTIPNGSSLTVTVALCSENASEQRFFLTNSNSDSTSNPGSEGGDGLEIILDQGLGIFKGPFPNGGVLWVSGQGSFEVGVSDSSKHLTFFFKFGSRVTISPAPIHELLAPLPLLGDATSNQAILFSAPFAVTQPPEATFPNYTLPQANLFLPQYTGGTQSSNVSLILAQTSAQSNNIKLTDIPQTGCSISARQSSNVGTILNQTLWSRGVDGWRNQWLIGGLTPSTNYTAYVVQDGTKVSGPIFFATKSGLCYYYDASETRV